jgi:hypothetical protein
VTGGSARGSPADGSTISVTLYAIIPRLRVLQARHRHIEVHPVVSVR